MMVIFYIYTSIGTLCSSLKLLFSGIGIHRNRTDPISQDDETKLIDSGVIGILIAKALSHAVFFYNCKTFGFRLGVGDGDEHRELKTSQHFQEEILKKSRWVETEEYGTKANQTICRPNKQGVCCEYR